MLECLQENCGRTSDGRTTTDVKDHNSSLSMEHSGELKRLLKTLSFCFLPYKRQKSSFDRFSFCFLQMLKFFQFWLRTQYCSLVTKQKMDFLYRNKNQLPSLAKKAKKKRIINTINQTKMIHAKFFKVYDA